MNEANNHSSNAGRCERTAKPFAPATGSANPGQEPTAERTTDVVRSGAGGWEEYVTEIPITEKGNLACPFCGGTKLSRIVPKRDPAVWWITCDRRGATGPNVTHDVGWNMRAFGEHLYVRKQDAEQLDLFGGRAEPGANYGTCETNSGACSPTDPSSPAGSAQETARTGEARPRRAS